MCPDFVNFVNVFQVPLIPEKILISQNLPRQGKIHSSFILTAFKIYLSVLLVYVCQFYHIDLLFNWTKILHRNLILEQNQVNKKPKTQIKKIGIGIV